MKRHITWIGLCLLAGTAGASSSPQQAVPVRYSMDVSGTITVSARGFVKAYRLERPGKLPGYVVQLLNRSIPAWTFQPNLRDGKPVDVKARMDIRLLATPLPNRKISVRIDQTTFGTGYENDDQTIHYKQKIKPPPYPWNLDAQHVTGTVFLLLRINRQGHVAKAAVEQVDLGTRGSSNRMTRWRRAFARSALKAAHNWQFTFPTKGKYASADHWDVVIPMVFNILQPGTTPAQMLRTTYGKWLPYIPGPVRYIPWQRHPRMAARAAPPAGTGIHMVGSGLRRIDHANG
jgi:TonB family protein